MYQHKNNLSIVSDFEENKYFGWIRLWRSITEKGWYTKSEYVHLWIHLMFQATHKKKEYLWNGNIIILNPGQFITTLNKISDETGISRSMCRRILILFENETQIHMKKSNTSTLISIMNYQTYQLQNET